MMKSARLRTVILYAVMTVYVTLVSLPLLWMAISALKTNREIFANPFGLPAAPQWSNFVDAWREGVAGYFLNSVLVTGVSVVLIVLVSTLAAYALSRLRFVGRTWIYLLFIAGYAIPLHTVLVPLYQSLNKTNLLNTWPGLIGPYVAFAIPFSVMLLYSFFVDFPTELEEAARLDGCNTWQMLFHVVLPLSKPGMATVAIFQGVFIWNEFLLALLVITDDKLKTLPLGLTAFQGRWAANIPLMMAALTLATAPMLLLYIVLQRQFTHSLAGFSKG